MDELEGLRRFLRDALSGLDPRSWPSDASDVAVAERADELVAGILHL